MAKKREGATKLVGLRRHAEKLLLKSKRDVAALQGKDVQQLVQELQVHQIELEMQNDELRRAQVELETARDRYVELYDFSPAGHLTLDTHGHILEANLRAGTLLGINRNALIRQPLARFIAAEDQATFHLHCQEVLTRGTRQACEVQLRKGGSVSPWVYLESLAVHEDTGRIVHWRMALLDVSARKLVEQELLAERAQLEAIIGSAMDAVITVDQEGRIMLFNRAAESMFLCSAAQAIGQSHDRFIPEMFRELRQGHMRRVVNEQASSHSMHRVGTSLGLRANGEEFPFEGSISHVRVNGQSLFTVILRDITERKVAEEALQSSTAFARAILNSLSSHVCVLDKDGVILKTNDAWCEFVRQYSDGVFTIGDVGHNYLDLCRRNMAGATSTGHAILMGLEAVLKGRDPIFSAEYYAQLPEEDRWFLMRVTPLKGEPGVVISHTDISERVRMALSLEQHILLLGDKREELESLTGKLIQAQEQERQRIARELHDDFNQRLAALSVELESLERAPISPSDPIAPQLAGIRGTVARLSDDLHDLAYKLHPSLLEHVGLEIAVRDHVAEFTKRTRLPLTFNAQEVPETISPQAATNLFRVMQESLQNVLKHAQATDVKVRLIGSSKGIGLSVSDNGKGFDPESNQGRRAGLGLVSMQERARLLGGFFRIHSRSGQGTKVCAWIPFSPGEA
jgi:PAS domain S-box-containing protein